MTPLLVTIFGESSFARAQHLERRPVFGARTHDRREPFHRLHVVIENLRRGVEHELDAPILRVEIGTSTSMMIDGSISRIARMVRAKCSAPPSFKSSRATAVMTTCLSLSRLTASATRCGSSSSSANGFAVETAQNPQARVQRSPAIIMVAVPWLQHSQRFGHCALSQTVCRRRSEMSALVEKKTGFEGSRTLIQGGFCAWCRAGSILAQDMVGEN